MFETNLGGSSGVDWSSGLQKYATVSYVSSHDFRDFDFVRRQRLGETAAEEALRCEDRP